MNEATLKGFRDLYETLRKATVAGANVWLHVEEVDADGEPIPDSDVPCQSWSFRNPDVSDDFVGDLVEFGDLLKALVAPDSNG